MPRSLCTAGCTTAGLSLQLQLQQSAAVACSTKPNAQHYNDFFSISLMYLLKVTRNVFKICLVEIHPWRFHAFSFLGHYYGLFTLSDTDSGIDSDSNSKPHGTMFTLYGLTFEYLSWLGFPIATVPIFGTDISLSGLGSESVSGSVNKPLLLWTFEDLPGHYILWWRCGCCFQLYWIGIHF